MIMHDYNRQGEKIVLLLQPMLASGTMIYEILGAQLGENVRCLAPDFAGHGEERQKNFESAEAEAAAIFQYLQENGICYIDLCYGASLGAAVLTQLLKKNLSFGTAFFEGCSFFEGARLLIPVVVSKVLQKQKIAAADPARAVKTIEGLFGGRYAKHFAEQFIGMSETSIRNIAAACGNNVHARLTPEAQKKCVFAYGARDFNVDKARRGCRRYYPNAAFRLWPGYNHCEKIIGDTDAYIRLLKSYLR